MTNEAILETLEVQPLSEEEKASRHILKRLTGPIASCKEGTRNGRKYNRELWENALNDEIFKEKVDNKGLFLELGHPDREEIDMSCACACIPEMPKIIDGDLYAIVDVLDTPAGNILNTLIDYGFKPGISSRGSGDVVGDLVDPETFMLETWDIVNTPALKKARLSVMESLDTNSANLRKALCESLESADEKDKKVMTEALHNLNIDINAEENTNESVSTPEKVEDKEILEQTSNETEVANNDGTENIIKSLQEALKSNIELEAKIKSLQNELAVSDTKVSKLEEDVNRGKSTIVRLTTLAKESKEKTKRILTLEEELKQSKVKIEELAKRPLRESREVIRPLRESIAKKDEEISSLNEQLETLKSTHENEIKSLNDNINSLKESLKTKEEQSLAKEKQLSESLNKSTKTIERYKTFSNNVAQRYIEVRAKNLGVKKDDIINRLSENYSLEEIDKVCDDLRNYKLNLSKLPFTLDNKSVVRINESKHIGITSTSNFNDDDYIGEDTLKAAGLKR